MVVSLLYVGVDRCVIRLKYTPMAAGRLSSLVGRQCVHGCVRVTTGPVSSRVGWTGG